MPKALANPPRARRHNGLKSWQKSIRPCGFRLRGCPETARCVQARRLSATGCGPTVLVRQFGAIEDRQHHAASPILTLIAMMQAATTGSDDGRKESGSRRSSAKSVSFVTPTEIFGKPQLISRRRARPPVQEVIGFMEAHMREFGVEPLTARLRIWTDSLPPASPARETLESGLDSPSRSHRRSSILWLLHAEAGDCGERRKPTPRAGDHRLRKWGNVPAQELGSLSASIQPFGCCCAVVDPASLMCRIINLALSSQLLLDSFG